MLFFIKECRIILKRTMIFCPLCNESNDEFATVCEHCHGFLQNRVIQLDLFDTAWGILENPQKTFRTITLAKHKTYAFSLFAFFGIGLFFACITFLNAGDRFDSLLQLIIVSILCGAVIGCCLAPLISLIHYRLIKTAHGQGRFKDSLAVSAYSLVPIVLSIIFILPIEISAFGMYFFTFNPSPSTINPGLYFILIGINVFCILWTIVLFVIGTKISFGVSLIRSLLDFWQALLLPVFYACGGCI